MKHLIQHLTLLVFSLAMLPIAMMAQLPYQTFEEGVTPKQRELYFYEMRAYPFGKIPQGARLNGLLHAESKMAQFRNSTQAVNQWRQIGPNNVGGRIRAIAVHPTDGKTLWVGAADGGVWKSTDQGGTWSPKMDNENAISMGALAVDPSNPDILYAGTGEMSSNIDAYNGTGIYKSTDGGDSWKSSGLTNVGTFSRIVVDPKNGNIVYAGGSKNNGGLYRSDDGGRSWARLSTFAISDITIDPDNSSEVWVAAWSRGIYHSTDGGRTLSSSNEGIDTTQTIGRTSVQAAPSNPNVLYALAEVNTSSAQIFKSNNRGASWKRVYNATILFAEAGNPQGWYDQFLTVKPDNENVVFAGGIGVIYTTNGGSNWIHIPGYSSYFHPDQHTLEFDPSNPSRFYLGNDGGMYRNDDYQTTTFTDISEGLEVTQFYGIAIDQSAPDRTYGGTQDNGTRMTSGVGIAGGDGGAVAVDHENPQYVYGETPRGELWKVDLAQNVSVPISRDFGDESDGDTYASWVSPIAMDPTISTVLYHGRTSVFQSVDGGGSWQKVSERFSGKVSAIAVSPVNHEIIYAGSERGMVKVSSNGGSNWEDRSYGTGLVNRAVTDFAPSLTDESTAYVSFSGFYTSHVFKTTDKGATWTDAGRGLPDVPVNALAIHPEDPQIIYAGTDIGMFISIDGGRTWANYNQGLPRVAVIDLEVHRSAKTLRAATHGRSMWEIDLEKPELGPMIVAPTGGEVWIGGTPNIISWNGFDGPVSIEYSVDDGQNWTLLQINVAGNSFRWNVADKPTTMARIRVTAMGDNDRTATSRTFTIEKFQRGSLISASTTLVVPYGIAYDGKFLWATDFVGTSLVKFDPKTLATVGIVQTDMPLNANDSSMMTDIAYVPERGTFFIHQLRSGGGGWLNEVSQEGSVLHRWPSPCTYPIGLAWMGGPGSDQPYLLVSDRDGTQNLFFVDPDDGTEVLTLPRTNKVSSGPRGITTGLPGQTFYQVITDFSGPNNTLVETRVQSYKIDVPIAEDTCTIALQSAVTQGYINARGIEIDTSDMNFWISDLGGNIYKIVSCDGKPATTPEPPMSVPITALPAGAALQQNMPNPFTGSTSIGFTLASPDQIRLMISDMAGRTISTLVSGRFEAGQHTVQFDPAGLPSGVYRYVLAFGNGAMMSRTMVLMK
jgi:photosystem II stability/assembly factor-like uncharacterized protein